MNPSDNCVARGSIWSLGEESCVLLRSDAVLEAVFMCALEELIWVINRAFDTTAASTQVDSLIDELDLVHLEMEISARKLTFAHVEQKKIASR